MCSRLRGFAPRNSYSNYEIISSCLAPRYIAVARAQLSPHTFQCVPYIHDACSSNHLTARSLGAIPRVSIPAVGEIGSCFSNLTLYHNSIGRPFTPRHSSRKPSTLLVSACRVFRALASLRACPSAVGLPWPLRFALVGFASLGLASPLRACLALLRLGLWASLGGLR